MSISTRVLVCKKLSTSGDFLSCARFFVSFPISFPDQDWKPEFFKAIWNTIFFKEWLAINQQKRNLGLGRAGIFFRCFQIFCAAVAWAMIATSQVQWQWPYHEAQRGSRCVEVDAFQGTINRWLEKDTPRKYIRKYKMVGQIQFPTVVYFLSLIFFWILLWPAGCQLEVLSLAFNPFEAE